MFQSDEILVKSEIPILLKYIKNAQSLDEYVNTTSKARFLLTLLGRLFIQEYRIHQINAQLSVILLLKGNYILRKQFMIVRLFDSLKNFKISKNECSQQLENLLQNVSGSTNILHVYLDESKFISFDNKNQYISYMEQNSQIKNQCTLLDYKICQQSFIPTEEIGFNQNGTILHSVVQNFIYGCTEITNNKLKQVLRRKKIKYNLTETLNTISYIIGLQMIEGGYQYISTEKKLQIKDTNKDINFNQLDLILRNDHKLLVIDWKFSRVKANDYFKQYQYKIQKYLKLAKSYFDCEVQFHLYCIHNSLRGSMYKFTSKSIQKEIKNISIDQEQQIYDIGQNEYKNLFNKDQSIYEEEQTSVQIVKQLIIIQ